MWTPLSFDSLSPLRIRVAPCEILPFVKFLLADMESHITSFAVVKERVGSMTASSPTSVVCARIVGEAMQWLCLFY